eukprot:Skav226322  [mRNA]  locus=scaffold3301:635617:652993:- [translate_table: standard]
MNKPPESANVGTSVGGLRLPLLRPLQEEVHVWVDAETGQGKTSGGSILAQHAAEALQSRELRVAVDAEWQDPRPLSLLQLAVSVQKQPPTVFLIDMVQPPSESTLEWCRKLLTGEHEVLVFSPKEDSRRLEQVGLLPGVDQENWLDLQRLDWGLGNQPGLQAVATRLHERWDTYRSHPQRRRPRVLDAEGARAKNDDLCCCFILPAALTRLMRKLRGLGLDTAILREGAPSRELVDSAEEEDRSSTQKMIILYYNTKNLLPARAYQRTYMLRSTSPDEQLREAFDVDVNSDCLCGRCVHCNAWDWQLVGRDEVKDNPKALEGAEGCGEDFGKFRRAACPVFGFWLCGGCGKVYWEGKMFVKELESLGWSAPRVRAALVREGLLSAEKALDRAVLLCSEFLGGSIVCFILPAALTRLMRKLRGLGLDTAILREGAPSRELVDSAEEEDRSSTQKVIILYYNTKNLLPARAYQRTYMLRSTSPDEQLREAFDVDVNSDCLCGRCVHCNAWDWQLVGRDEVKDNPKALEGAEGMLWQRVLHLESRPVAGSFLPGRYLLLFGDNFCWRWFASAGFC